MCYCVCVAAVLKCVVCVGADFPETPPTIAITTSLSGEGNPQELQLKVLSYL